MREPDYKAFAIAVMSGWPENDIDLSDGIELQDLAEKHGMLVAKEMQEPCGEGCYCSQEVGDSYFPLTCYRWNWDRNAAPRRQEHK